MPFPKVLFSDVDGTIIRGKSLFEFAEHLGRRLSQEDAAELRAFVESVIEQLRAGARRDLLNRAFYAAVLAHRPLDEVFSVVHEWFQTSRSHPQFFNLDICEYLADVRKRGTRIVLVSGAFEELLAPIAEYVGASDVLATRLELVNGRFTGRFSGVACIGAGKAVRVQSYARTHGLNLADCAGLGDHASDIPFLSLVGHAMATADADPALLRHARERRWQLLGSARSE